MCARGRASSCSSIAGSSEASERVPRPGAAALLRDVRLDRVGGRPLDRRQGQLLAQSLGRVEQRVQQEARPQRAGAPLDAFRPSDGGQVALELLEAGAQATHLGVVTVRGGRGAGPQVVGGRHGVRGRRLGRAGTRAGVAELVPQVGVLGLERGELLAVPRPVPP